MAMLLSEVVLNYTPVNRYESNEQKSTKKCQSIFGGHMSSAAASDISTNAWSPFVPLLKLSSTEYDPQSGPLSSRSVLGKFGEELPSTSSEITKCQTWNSPNSIPKEKRLYKTELCRSWEEKGRCRYAGKCQYAHGDKELRPVARHPKFKTEICCTFVTTGTCPYGRRCRFIHKNVPITAVGKQTTSKHGKVEQLISSTSLITASSRRLPIFVKLSQGHM